MNAPTLMKIHEMSTFILSGPARAQPKSNIAPAPNQRSGSPFPQSAPHRTHRETDEGGIGVRVDPGAGEEVDEQCRGLAAAAGNLGVRT